MHWPRLIFFSLPNKEPVVPAITGQNAEYYHTSILKRCNSRSSLSLLSGVIAIFFNIYFIRNFIVITLRRGGMISLLSLDIVYSTYRKNILRAIKSRLICLSGSRQKKKCSINQKKGRTFRFGRCQSTPPDPPDYFPKRCKNNLQN